MFEVHYLKGSGDNPEMRRQQIDPNPKSFPSLPDAKAYKSSLGDADLIYDSWIVDTSLAPKSRGPKLSPETLTLRIIELETRLLRYQAEFLAATAEYVDPAKFKLSARQRQTQAKWSQYIGSIYDRTDTEDM
jgi:hypothetical protein